MRRRDLGHAEELRHRAGDPHPLALGDRRRAAAAEDEDALGGRRVGVGVGVLLLEEEARSCVLPWKSPTTTPSTVTVAPGIGVAAPLPWTSWIKVGCAAATDATSSRTQALRSEHLRII